MDSQCSEYLKLVRELFLKFVVDSINEEEILQEITNGNRQNALARVLQTIGLCCYEQCFRLAKHLNLEHKNEIYNVYNETFKTLWQIESK